MRADYVPGPPPTEGPLTREELQLATRNRGMPLEALRYDITPTGLHYLLIHFDIPFMDESTYRLSVGGNVEDELTLTIDEIKAFPSQTFPVTLECAGNGRSRLMPRPISTPWINEAIGTAEWTGTSLCNVLDVAGVQDGTVEVSFTGADRGVEGGIEQNYARSLSLSEAQRPEVMLVYAMNGQPLQPQHGFPLRLLVPGWYGMTSVKWLKSINVLTEPFDGYHQTIAYRFITGDDDPGKPVTRIKPRALMAPPGIPDYLTRKRLVDSGRCVVEGRAWSGTSIIEKVEFGVDGKFSPAELDAPVGQFAWRRWRFEWNATPGEHELTCRATDADGNVQPIEQPWNKQGVSNNHAQTVSVLVR